MKSNLRCKSAALIVFASIALTGCLASVDLSREDSPLPSSERTIAVKISKLTSLQCIKSSYDRNTGQRMSGETTFYNPVSIKRLFVSESGWYKAEVLSDGVWDNVYLHNDSGRFVCGQQSWDSYVDTKDIRFIEFGLEQKRIQN